MSHSLLVPTLQKYAKENASVETAIKGLSFHHANAPTQPVSYMFAPHLCLIAQGAKHITLGTENFIYDENSYVLSAVDLPLVSKIIKASPNEPYLGLTLELDLTEIADILTQGHFQFNSSQETACGIGVSKLTPALSDAVCRLLALLENPQDIRMLAPMIKSEIYYRLLAGDQGYKLKQILSVGSRKNQISKAVEWLKHNYNDPLHVKELADLVGMSESSFYHHFRELTSLSPVQYQKKIRLNEAKRLMLVKRVEAGEAAYSVGYESPTQFNREYKKMFGNPPRKDVQQILAQSL